MGETREECAECAGRLEDRATELLKVGGQGREGQVKDERRRERKEKGGGGGVQLLYEQGKRHTPVRVKHKQAL